MNILRHEFLAAVIVVSGLIGYRGASVQASDPRVEFVLKQMQHEREKLRSGHCVVTGTFKEVSRAGKVEGPITISYRFMGKDLIRLDVSVPGQVADPTKLRPDPATGPGRVIVPSVLGVQRQKMAIKYDDMCYWNQDMPYIGILKRKDFPVNTTLHYFDPHTIGLCDRGCRKVRKNLKQCLEDIAMIPNAKIIENDKNWIIEWRSTVDSNENNYCLYRCEVDTKNGFVPIRYDIYIVVNGAKHPHQHLSSKWEEREGCYIPQKSEFRIGDSRNYFEAIKYKFDWKSVNQPIPEESFSHESFGLPDSLGLVDARSGESFFLKEPSGWSAPSGTKEANQPKTSRNRIRRPRMWRLIVAGVLVVMILAIIIFRIKQKPARPPTSSSSDGGDAPRDPVG